MLMKDLDRLASEGSLRATLKDKSRRRRVALARSAPAPMNGAALRNDLARVLELVSIPLNDLSLHGRRLRKSEFGHVREVANSIGALGFCAPLLVSKDKLVLDGEIRLEAARLLGMNAVPCVKIDHLSEAEQRVLRLAVNRLSEKGQWNLDELIVEFEN